MAKKTTAQTGAQTEIAGTEKKTRKPTVLSPEVQELVDKAKAAVQTQRNTIKEAKSLDKVVKLIASLGEWALDQIPAAIERRREALKGQ